MPSALYDNTGHIFHDEIFLSNASVGLLNSFSWPPDPLNLALHGSNEIVCVTYWGFIPKVHFNLQATKLFIVTSATKWGVVTTPLRFRVSFKILYRVIRRLIQHCLLPKMVYLNIIYYIQIHHFRQQTMLNQSLYYTIQYYVIATRNYDFLIAALFRN